MRPIVSDRQGDRRAVNVSAARLRVLGGTLRPLWGTLCLLWGTLGSIGEVGLTSFSSVSLLIDWMTSALSN